MCNLPTCDQSLRRWVDDGIRHFRDVTRVRLNLLPGDVFPIPIDESRVCAFLR